MERRHFLYIPKTRLLLFELCGLIISYLLVIAISPTKAPEPYSKYLGVFGMYGGLNILVAYLTGRYDRRLKQQNRFYMAFNEFYTTLLSYAVMVLLLVFVFEGYSLYIFSAYVLVFLVTNIIIITMFFAYIYALDPEEESIVTPRNIKAIVANPPYDVDADSYSALRMAIVKERGEVLVSFLERHISLRSSNTTVVSTHDLFDIEKIASFRYDVIVNLFELNNIRGINMMFCSINEKLPDDGLFVGCFVPKSVAKRNILHRYPGGIKWIVYTFYYIVRRILPKLFMTKRLYYDITKGRNRVLSKTEVFGRLYYCGYAVIAEKKINDMIYFVAQRRNDPPVLKKRRYGPIIALNRVGKNGKTFKFYKMRTMYPYSEYLQEYIYEHYSLQEGGKFKHDIRINTMGHYMRKYWIDELPMLMNLLKGDMKLVGVRPLSKQYFSLYSNELQELRTQFKPGLLPPFYADMPKTLDEIQESEMRYLKMCGKRGVLITDFIYFWRICFNILFKRARSH